MNNLAGGLGSLIPGDQLTPERALPQPANPTTSAGALPQSTTPAVSDTSQSILNIRALAGPIDPLNILQSGMLDAQNRMNSIHAKLPFAQTQMDEGRQGYMKWLESQYSPERESNLNWQALGNMGVAMMQPANDALPGGNTQWGRGAAAYQDQRNTNRIQLDKAGDALAQARMAMSENDYQQLLEQYKLAQTDFKDSQKGVVEWQKEIRKNNPSKIVTDQTGAVWKYDPSTNQRTMVLNSNGLTPQDGAALGDYYKQLTESYGLDNQGIIQSKYQEEVARRQKFNRSQMGLSSNATSSLPEDNQSITGNVDSLPSTPSGRPNSQMSASGNNPIPNTALSDYMKLVERIKNEKDPKVLPKLQAALDDMAKDMQNGDGYNGNNNAYGIFTSDDILNPSVAAPVGQGKLEQEQWKLNQIKYTDEAMKDEAAARANLAQTQAMYESSKGALTIGAKTGALQPFINGVGLVFDSLGLEGGISAESVKGKSFQAIANQAVQVMQNAAKGTQTEGDAKRFAESLVQVKNPEEANILIMKFMESQLWKREQELTFRSLYSAVNPSAAGASSKWSEWSRSTPVIQQINNKPVFVSDYIKNFIKANPEAAKLHGEDQVKREAIKAWRKRSN